MYIYIYIYIYTRDCRTCRRTCARARFRETLFSIVGVRFRFRGCCSISIVGVRFSLSPSELHGRRSGMFTEVARLMPSGHYNITYYDTYYIYIYIYTYIHTYIYIYIYTYTLHIYIYTYA